MVVYNMVETSNFWLDIGPTIVAAISAIVAGYAACVTKKQGDFARDREQDAKQHAVLVAGSTLERIRSALLIAADTLTPVDRGASKISNKMAGMLKNILTEDRLRFTSIRSPNLNALQTTAIGDVDGIAQVHQQIFGNIENSHHEQTYKEARDAILGLADLIAQKLPLFERIDAHTAPTAKAASEGRAQNVS